MNRACRTAGRPFPPLACTTRWPGDDFNDLLETIAHQNEMRRAVLQTVADEASRRRTLFEHERDGGHPHHRRQRVWRPNPRPPGCSAIPSRRWSACIWPSGMPRLRDDDRGSLLARVGSAGLFCESTHRRKDGTVYCAEVSPSWADCRNLLSCRPARHQRSQGRRGRTGRLSLDAGGAGRATHQGAERPSAQLNAIFTLSPTVFCPRDLERFPPSPIRFSGMTGLTPRT